MESHSDPRTTTSHRREYPGDDSDDSHINRRSDRDCTGPLKEEGPKVIMEDHLKEDATQIEDILGEIIQV